MVIRFVHRNSYMLSSDGAVLPMCVIFWQTDCLVHVFTSSLMKMLILVTYFLHVLIVLKFFKHTYLLYVKIFLLKNTLIKLNRRSVCAWVAGYQRNAASVHFYNRLTTCRTWTAGNSQVSIIWWLVEILVIFAS